MTQRLDPDEAYHGIEGFDILWIEDAQEITPHVAEADNAAPLAHDPDYYPTREARGGGFWAEWDAGRLAGHPSRFGSLYEGGFDLPPSERPPAPVPYDGTLRFDRLADAIVQNTDRIDEAVVWPADMLSAPPAGEDSIGMLFQQCMDFRILHADTFARLGGTRHRD